MPRKKISVKRLGVFSGHSDCLYSLEHSAKPGHFYSGGGEGYIVEWDYEEPGDGKLLVKVPRPVYSMLLHPSGKLLFAGTAAGNLHLIDLQSNQEIRNIEAHAGGLFDMKLEGNALITCGADGFIRYWNPTEMELLSVIRASEKSARTLAVNPAGNELAVGFSDHAIRIYNDDVGAPRVLNSHTNSVFALAYSPDRRHLASGGRDATLQVRNVDENYELAYNIPAHRLHIHAIAYAPSGRLVATGSMDKTIKIWDATNFDLLKVIDKERNEAHSFSVNKLLWIDEKRLLSGSDDRTAMLWEIIEEEV